MTINKRYSDPSNAHRGESVQYSIAKFAERGCLSLKYSLINFLFILDTADARTEANSHSHAGFYFVRVAQKMNTDKLTTDNM